MKTMLNDILEAKKGRTAGRFHNTDKKKPTTPDHKTKLKLKVGNQKENYMTVKETAAKWKITERQVQILCKTNRIQGAIQVSRIWLIPSNALKPTRQ